MQTQFSRPFACCLLIAVCCGIGGCASLDMLHPSNTWKMNRGPALDQGDGYFSVSDTAATEQSLRETDRDDND